MLKVYLLIALLSYTILFSVYKLVVRHRQRQVVLPIAEGFANEYLLTIGKVDKAIAERYGCLPPPRLQNKRPLGLDRLKQIFRANIESRLMELFLFHFRQTGYTLEQVFLRAQAFATVDPANLEAILSTNFGGSWTCFEAFWVISMVQYPRIEY